MSRQACRILAAGLAAGAAACVTTSTPPPAPPPAPLPAPAQMVPTRLTPERALDRVETRLMRYSIMEGAVVRPDGSPLGAGGLARSSPVYGAVKLDDGTFACAGWREVVQVTASRRNVATMVRLSCHTERAHPQGEECFLDLEPECPKSGDRAVADLALDLLRI